MRRIRQLSLRNYRLFGETEQTLDFAENLTTNPLKNSPLSLDFRKFALNWDCYTLIQCYNCSI